MALRAVYTVRWRWALQRKPDPTKNEATFLGVTRG
jgi:hypothetical protein